MGRHILGRDKHGNLSINQVDAPRAADAPLVPGLPREQTNEQPAPAYAELMTDLYDRNTVWAKSRIARLEDRTELDKVRAFEVVHPKIRGGRPAVLQAVDERLLDLQVRYEVDKGTTDEQALADRLAEVGA